MDKTKSCSCGCNTCSDNKSIIIKEQLTNSNIIVSEGLNYLINNDIDLLENIHRYGSKEYLKIIREARYLYSRDLIDVNPINEWILQETELGEFDYYEGKLVPLDLIFEEEIKGGKADNLTISQISKITSFDYNELKINFIIGVIHELEHTTDLQIAQEIAKDHLIEDPLYYTKLKSIEEQKQPQLNKPKRSSGPKKYYVYTRNPKTRKIIKVNFGDSGNLSAKINNPKARKSFVARHDCKNKKDKTKPGYWSCRLPRYAKSLGIKGGGNFMW